MPEQLCSLMNCVPIISPKHSSLACQDMDPSTETGIATGRLKKVNKYVVISVV